MLSIDHLLMGKLSAGFVGRGRELEGLHRHLCDEADWKLVHMYGMRGIGKTALLRKFAQDVGNYRVFYIEGREGAPNREAFLSQLLDAITSVQDQQHPFQNFQAPPTISQTQQLLNSIAHPVNKVILLLDDFERWANIHGWLRNRLFPSLSQHVRIFTAGQYPLDPFWTQQPGWSRIIAQYAVGPLNRKSTDQYATNCGVENPAALADIWGLSGGIPLAIEWSCRAIREQGDLALAPGVLRTRLIHTLCTILLDTARLSPDLFRLLNLTSLVWRFNQDLLAEIGGESIPDSLFQQLCQLSYVYWGEESWSLHHTVRDWLRLDFSIRSPETYTKLKHKTASILQHKLDDAPESVKLDRLLERLYLIDNETLRRYCFHETDERFEITGVEESDLPLLVQMRREWELALLPCKTEENAAIKRRIRKVWEQFPASFVAFRHRGQLAAFCSVLPLCKKARHLLQSDPIYETYIRYTEVQDQEYVFWMTAARTDSEFDPVGSVSRYLYTMLGCNRLITAITFLHDEIDIFRCLGFSHLSWADTVSPSGLSYRALQIDLRKQGLFELRGTEQQSSLAYSASHLKKEQRLFVRNLLKRLHEFESDDLLIIQAKRQLQAQSLRRFEPAGIRRTLIQAIEQLESGGESSLVIGQILRFVYIDRMGTHENIAARLGMSESTFYRYLNRGIDHLTGILFKT